MLSKILIATDASEASSRMVECLGHLKRVGTRSVKLVHVLDAQNIGGLYSTLKDFYLPKLEEQARALEAQGLTTAIEVPLGVPAFEINRLAEADNARLIVLGSRGSSRVKELFLGSTALNVLHSAKLPVLLVRLEIVTEDGGERCRVTCTDFFHHVLHPTDFSETAERAYQHLEHIVRETHCAVTLLHVQDKARLQPHLADRLEEFNRIDTERLERRRERLLKLGAAAVESYVDYGAPAAEILRRARAGGFSLVLMGTHGKGLVEEFFLGSVAHNVARRAPVPVLFVPALRA